MPFIAGTSIMYIGLTLTYSSTFQMLRGSIIVFVAILSVLLLKRRLCLREWIGIFIILIGLLTVGYSDFRDRKGVKKGAETHTNSEMTVGVILIVLSQAIIAMQMVYEEKFVYKYNIPPLQAVGWEGVFGFLTLSVLIVPMNFITLPDQEHTMEDIPLALNKFGSDWTIGGLLLVSIISIAIFNYSGLSVTKELSATSRMVLDSMRTILVWGAELIFGWKLFDPMQLIGFAVLLVGMCAYNDIILPQVDQILRRMRKLPHKESSKHVSPYDGNSQQQNLSRQNSSASNSKNQNVWSIESWIKHKEMSFGAKKC